MVWREPLNLSPRSSPLASTCGTMIVIGTEHVTDSGKRFARI